MDRCTTGKLRYILFVISQSSWTNEKWRFLENVAVDCETGSDDILYQLAIISSAHMHRKGLSIELYSCSKLNAIISLFLFRVIHCLLGVRQQS